MSGLNKILAEDKKWMKEFRSMPVSGDCDARCGKPAKRWFGNTSRATCGELQCITILEASYDACIAK